MIQALAENHDSMAVSNGFKEDRKNEQNGPRHPIH